MCICLVCTHVCARAYVYTYVCLCTHVSTHLCACMYTCVLLCICAHMCTPCTRLCARTRLHSCVCVHVCVCSCVCLCTRMGVAIRFLAFSDSRGRTPTSHTTAPSRPCWAAGASGARGPDPQVLHQDLQSKPPSERTQNHWLGPGMATPSRGSTGPSREPLSVRRAGPRVQDCPGSQLGGP